VPWCDGMAVVRVRVATGDSYLGGGAGSLPVLDDAVGRQSAKRMIDYAALTKKGGRAGGLRLK